MSTLANDIRADKRDLKSLLSNKFEIDYFQREYKWERKHVEQLIVDLESSFISNYQEGHTLADVTQYDAYYMGPVILIEKGNLRSIVDGQQRLTSITLLLIFLYNKQKGTAIADDIRGLIFSRKGSKTSFNIENKERENILRALYNDALTEYDIDSEKSESARNMYERFCDIESMFPDTILGENMSLFTDWLREKVVFVEILAYSIENAYTIFETMNDRGLNLTPTEMMKGYILTKVGNEDRIEELNELWKNRLSELYKYSGVEDMEFIRAWLRGIYAVTIRESAVGSENKDFEKIGTRFHKWIQDNTKMIGLKSPEDYYYFIKGDFDFFVNLYIKIKKSVLYFNSNLSTLYLSSFWSIASSLTYPLLIAPVNKLDDEDTITKKIDAVSKFLDIFTITRILNGKSITQTGLKYTLYTFVLEIRNKSLDELRTILKNKLRESGDLINENLIYKYSFSDTKFIQYLFARIIYYLEETYGEYGEYNMSDLMVSRKKNRYVLAPIVKYEPEYYKDVIDENDFWRTYSRLGNFVLIPKPVEEEFNLKYDIDKLLLLGRENILASLALEEFSTDSGNINFGFQGMTELNHENIVARTKQIFCIIQEIWSIDNI